MSGSVAVTISSGSREGTKPIVSLSMLTVSAGADTSVFSAVSVASTEFSFVFSVVVSVVDALLPLPCCW